MNSTEKTQLYILKGLISELPKEDQDKVYDMVSGFHQFVADYRSDIGIEGDALIGALSLIALEMQLKYMGE